VAALVVFALHAEEGTTVERRTTKVAMLRTSVFVPSRDRELVFLAAKRAGQSQSEFIRTALRERAVRVLANGSEREP
jgi:Ribbon-helix-helix protein, copG family